MPAADTGPHASPPDAGNQRARRRSPLDRITARAGEIGNVWSLSAALIAGVVAMAVAPALAAAADPPPGRAYELVSPANKPSGASAVSTRTGGLAMPARAADVGERVVYGLSASVADSPSWAPNPLVFGERTPTGWRARTAIRSSDGGNTALEVSIGEVRAAWLSPDGREIAFGIGQPLGGPVDGRMAQIYRSADEDGDPYWLSMPADGIAPTSGISSKSISANGDDLETIAFSSTAPLLAEAIGKIRVVYAYRDGALQIVSLLPDGTVASAEAEMANMSGSLTGVQSPARVNRNQVAGGGRFVLFRVGGTQNGGALYVRDLERNKTYPLTGGEDEDQPDEAVGLNSTLLVGASVGLATVPGGLVFAARDAVRAFFYGLVGPNVPGALVQIYEADLSTGEVTPRPAINGAPLQVSLDGERLIFLTRPDGDGVRQLRFWDRSDPGTSDLVGEISGGDANVGFARVFEPTADGRSWIFSAAGSPDPDRVNVNPSTRQLYRWVVSDGAPTCLTCEPVDGVARTSGVNMAVQDGGRSETLMAPTELAQPGDDATIIAQPGHGLSADGRFLLFDSPDRLVATDTNVVRDVYLWDRDGGPGGRLYLVTSGQGNTPSWALDLSPDGVNAFFSTREGLVPADRDGAYDVYSARIGEGFPRRPDLSCAGEACRPSAVPAAPGSPRVGSVSFAGRGNVSEAAGPGRASVRVARLRAVVGRAAMLRVRVSAQGRIAVRGAHLRNAGKSAKRAGVYSVRIALNPKARRALARRGKLRVNARVVYRAEGGERATRAVRVVFKQPASRRAVSRKGGR